MKPVDAGGATVIPGMIDASTDIGLNEPGVRNYDDVSEILPFDQMLRTRVAYRADSIAIPVARTEGITTVGVRPGGGTISGEIPVMNLDGWTWEEATLRPAAGLAFNFPGAAGGRGGGGGGRGGAAPPTGPDPMKTLNQLLERARVYAKQPATRQVDWTLEPFLPVLDRRQALYVSAAHRAGDSRRGGLGREAERAHRAADRRRCAARRRTAQAARRAGDPLEHPVAAAARGRVPRLPVSDRRACSPRPA